MNAKEFLQKVFKIYPPSRQKQEDIQGLFDEYYYRLMQQGNFDYDSAYNELFETYRKNALPSYPELYETLCKYRIVQNDNGMTCPVQIINFNIIKNGEKREYAFSTATDNYADLKRKWEKLGWYVITDKYGEEIKIKDVHYAK